MTTTPDPAGLFQFAPEHDELRRSVARFAAPFRETYLPLSRSDDFPWQESHALGNAGLLGYGVTETWGGQGENGRAVDRVVTGVVVEELARANFYLAMLVLPATVSGQLLERHL